MPTLWFANGSGWALTLAIPVTIALPYALRRKRLAQALRIFAQGKSWFQRMRLHYWLGYFITGATLAHAFVAMRAFGASAAGQAAILGLYLATGALFLLFGQVTLGRMLQRPDAPNRRLMRRLHFTTMLGIVALAAGHIALNSSTLHLAVK